VSITTPTVNPTHSVTATPLSIGGTASDNVGVTQVTLGQRPGWQRHGDGHDELDGERDRAAVGGQCAHGDGARCGG
jgi:hypothetical protein